MQDYNILRQRAALSILLDRPFTEELPFSVKPKGVVPIAKIKAMLRTHYEGTIYDAPWHRAQFPGAAPHDKTVRRVCTGSTVESTVWAFAERPELTTLWVAFGHPCTLPFIPLHPLAGIPGALDPMKDPAATLKAHLEPDKDYVVWRGDDWQKLRDFQSLFELLYDENFQAQQNRLWSMEHFMALRNDETLARAAALFAEKKDGEAKNLLAGCDAFEFENAVKVMDEVFSSLRSVPVEIDHDAMMKARAGRNLTLAFRLDMQSVPAEESLLFGLGSCNARTQWAPAVTGSLRELGRGWWSVEVKPDRLVKTLGSAEGKFECWLGGRCSLGHPFGGWCLIESR